MAVTNYVDPPLVTCIVTCYIKVPYLYEAIESVLSQEYPNLELIVTDDGTPEFNAEDISDFINRNKKKNIRNTRVIHHNENVGTVRNIRGAIDISNGKYCVNLDGDDVFHHDTVITEMVDTMEKKGLDLLEGSKIRCDSELNAIEKLPTPKEMKMISKLNTAKKQLHAFAVFQFYNIGGGSGIAYLREKAFNIGLFDESYRNWQDGPSLVSYVRHGKRIPFFPEIIAIKYRGGGVSNAPKKNADSFSHISEDRIKFIETVTIPDRWNPHVFLRRKILFRYFWDISNTNWERISVFLRFPEQGIKMRINKYKKMIIVKKTKDIETC